MKENLQDSVHNSCNSFTNITPHSIIIIAAEDTSATIGIDSPQTDKSCDPNAPVVIDALDFSSFFGDDDSTSDTSITATCENDGGKRSTGHIVLHFTVHKSISSSCSAVRLCVLSSLRSLRPAALAVINTIKSGSLQITITTLNDSQSFNVSPIAEVKRIEQACLEGSKFVNNQCGEILYFSRMSTINLMHCNIIIMLL